MPHRDPLYRRHRFPAEIIAHAVWLYFRFPLSLRMVENLLAARGIIVSHQTIRQWAIRGKKHWLLHAVDQDGFALEVLVQSRRNAKAANA
jgi:putative transposase